MEYPGREESPLRLKPQGKVICCLCDVPLTLRDVVLKLYKLRDDIRVPPSFEQQPLVPHGLLSVAGEIRGNEPQGILINEIRSLQLRDPQ